MSRFPIPFTGCKWTLPRTVGLVVALAMTPAVLFALGFVHFQIYPGIVPVESPLELGLPLETLHATGPRGERVVAWYLPPPHAGTTRQPVVVILHGLAGNRATHLAEARMLSTRGFGVATIDLRYHGDSDRLPVTFGLEEAGEVSAVVDRLVERPDVDPDRIGVLGFSMGAVTALHTASMDPRIRCVVADSPFVSLEEEARRRIRAFTCPALESYFWWPCAVAGFGVIRHWPSEWDVLAWVPRLRDRPLLLIHGLQDDAVDPSSSRRIRAARPEYTELWTLPNSGHIAARVDAPDEFARRVGDFFARGLHSRALAVAP